MIFMSHFFEAWKHKMLHEQRWCKIHVNDGRASPPPLTAHETSATGETVVSLCPGCCKRQADNQTLDFQTPPPSCVFSSKNDPELSKSGLMQEVMSLRFCVLMMMTILLGRKFLQSVNSPAAQVLEVKIPDCSEGVSSGWCHRNTITCLLDTRQHVYCMETPTGQ